MFSLPTLIVPGRKTTRWIMASSYLPIRWKRSAQPTRLASGIRVKKRFVSFSARAGTVQQDRQMVFNLGQNRRKSRLPAAIHGSFKENPYLDPQFYRDP